MGLAPVFLAVTHGLPAPARMRIAWRAFLILFGTALAVQCVIDGVRALTG